MAVNRSPEAAVNRFLKTGTYREIDASELARACGDRVRAATQHANKRALRLGQRFVDRARPHGGLLLTSALRARGWAQLVAGQYAEAEQSYLEARGMLRGDAVERSRIDRALIDIYMYLDRADEAGRRAKRALATFRRLGSRADVAKTQVNYANVLHRQDRHREAGRLYRQAARYFDRAGIEPAAALCWYNLANTRVQLFDFAEAEELYTRAREIFERHGDPLHATGCLYGMAWLHMLAGEFHQALGELTRCEEFYRAGAQKRELLLCELDRAETYLSLNLLNDARRTAQDAGRRARRLGLTYESAKASLFAGRAALGLGRRGEARRALRFARQAFERGGNDGFTAASQLSLVQAGLDDAEASRLLESAHRTFRKAQLPLWQGICDLHELNQKPDRRTIAGRLARNPAVKTVPHLYAGWQTIQGDRAYSQKRLREAEAHWTRAADTLDAVRLKLPPVELRSAYMRGQSDPFQRLIESKAEPEPRVAAAWTERRKTAGIWATPGEVRGQSPQRERIESGLTELAQRVAAYAGSGGHSSGSRSVGVAITDPAQERLHARLRRHLAELELGVQQSPESIEAARSQLEQESYRQPVIQFYVGPRDILAFVHDRGTCRAHRYVDGVQTLDTLMAQWRFLVECAAHTPGGYARTQVDDERDVLNRIGQWLLPPLELSGSLRRVLIFPEGPLVNLPWLALRPGGTDWTESTDVVLSPSLSHYRYARTQTVRSGRIRIFVGERQGLDHLDREISTLRSRLHGRQTTTHDPGRRADWPDGGQSRIFHYSGHALLRSDNPLYSALMLADGPLFAADLRMKRHRVNLVTLAACRTGQYSSLPGDESTGLVRALLEMGARNVVASHWAVADRSTALWMNRFYEYYMGGAAVSRAVRQAARDLRQSHPSVYHWGAFSAFGCG